MAAQEFAIAGATIAAPAFGWLFYQVVSNKAAIDAIRESLAKIEKSQDTILEYILDR